MTVVIPYNENDWQLAERLCDALLWIGLNKPKGHCLLVPNITVHAEYKLKVKLAAELAFVSVDQLEVTTPKEKVVGINSTFRQVAHYVYQSYKEPWLWLEADNVPIKTTWMRDLFKAYEDQPKRFMGRFMKAKAGTFMSRTGIYPQNSIHDLDNPCKGEPPFERVANILPRCASTPLIHMERWTPESVVPPEVVLVNGDRSGQLIEQMIENPRRKKVIA